MNYKQQLFAEKVFKWTIPIGVGLFGLSNAVYNVDGGQKAVIFDRLKGVMEGGGEGMHFLVPILQRPVIFDIRTRPRAITTTTGSKDMQTISLTLRVLHRPCPDKLPTIYSRLGLDYDERVLPSIANEVLKATVAQYDASELITQRELVSAQIRAELVKRANDFNILLEDVSLTHLAFGKEFTSAVEAKQVAQQEAERAKFVVEKAEQEKKAAIVKAEGESHAAHIISDALSKSGMGMIDLRRIEAAREVAATLANSQNVVYLPGGQSILLQAR